MPLIARMWVRSRLESRPASAFQADRHRCRLFVPPGKGDFPTQCPTLRRLTQPLPTESKAKPNPSAQ